MSEINDGGAAFPHPDYLHAGPDGMSLRDYFAANALAGILQMIATGQHELGIVRPTGAQGIAHSAYELADALIEARKV
jgi:hypothetical protein